MQFRVLAGVEVPDFFIARFPPYVGDVDFLGDVSRPDADGKRIIVFPDLAYEGSRRGECRVLVLVEFNGRDQYNSKLNLGVLLKRDVDAWYTYDAQSGTHRCTPSVLP